MKNEKLTTDQVKENAMSILKCYTEAIEATENEGELFEYLLGICKNKNEVDPYYQFLTMQNLFKVLAKPKVQKAILLEIPESNLDEIVDLVDRLSFFFNVMRGEQFTSMLQYKEIELYGSEADIWHMEYLIERTERKMKSISPKTQINSKNISAV